MFNQAFVGRARELAWLQAHLEHAIEGQGQIVFITGEPGGGKSALVREFARTAQDVHADLVVSIGECNAQTGIGDPYLPFREILGLLTGDVEAKLAQGTITSENAKRLRALLQSTGQALVEIGPNLINFFIPGTLLISLAARFLANKAGWLKPLQQLNDRKTTSAGEGALDQNHIFEQYTNVLKLLATKQPLILVIDDLQWADVGSISLLFHLGRRISTSRIMIVGVYRSDEVAAGRSGERHPLEKVLAEFKRNAGDIVVDLSESGEKENRQFVESLLDTEPNCLGKEFREALFQHTDGQALFTVELLHSMQERGNLRKDEQDRWVEGTSLNWSTLPERVEGVIEERIGRLSDRLREILRVASVEGEDFTAQVIARIQEVRERQLLHTLSEELCKRHRLVNERSEVRVGHQVLSLYQFAHALFQHYLYNELGTGERRLLHGEIAHTLEELYAGSTNDIAVRLARHYTEAGEAEKAIEYLLMAGDRARRLYANREAIDHYQRALALLPANASFSLQELARHIYEEKGDALNWIGQHSHARVNYQSALASPLNQVIDQARLRRKIGSTWREQYYYPEALQAYVQAESILNLAASDKSAEYWQEWIQVLLEIDLVYYWLGQIQESDALHLKLKPIIDERGSPPQRAAYLQRLGSTEFRRNRQVATTENIALSKAALAVHQEAGNQASIPAAQFNLGFFILWSGDPRASLEPLSIALHQSERTGDVNLQARCLAYLTIAYRWCGHMEEVERCSIRSLQVATIANMPEYIAMAKANQAWMAWRTGKVKLTQQLGREALDLWRQLPSGHASTPFQWLALWPMIAVDLEQGSDAGAIAYIRVLLDPTQRQLPKEIESELQKAITMWEGNETEKTRILIKQVLDSAQQMGWL